MKPVGLCRSRKWSVALSAIAVVAAALVALSIGAGSVQAQCPTCTTGYGCVEDFTPGANCTASDVQVASMSVIGYKDNDSCAYVGDTAQVYLQTTLIAGAATRYDVSMYVSLDGLSAQSASRLPNGTSCYHDILTPIGSPVNPTSGVGPFYDGEGGGDICGDIQQGISTYYNLDVLTLPCIDANNDGQVDPVNVALGWDNGSAVNCFSVADAYPSTKSKCKAGTVNVPELDIRKIVVDKVTIPSGHAQMFNFSITGPTPATFALADQTPPYYHTSIAAGTYAVAETVPSGWVLSTDINETYCTDYTGAKFSPSSIDLTSNREVRCYFTNRLSDWGDLPNGTQFNTTPPFGWPPELEWTYQWTASYCTTLSQNGASHTLAGNTSAIWLGPTIDAELTGVVSDLANGDDITPPLTDDEDGITLVNPGGWLAGFQGALTATFSASSPDGAGSGYLVVWFDWDHDGLFQADEAMVNTGVTWTAATSAQTFNFTIPSCEPGVSCVPGRYPMDTPLFYRARLFAAAPTNPATAYCGMVMNGEVEDYVYETPTGVDVFGFQATGAKKSIAFSWATGNVIGLKGFNLYRATSLGGTITKVNAELISAVPGPALYEYTDETVKGKRTYYYWLESVGNSGVTQLFGPAEARAK